MNLIFKQYNAFSYSQSMPLNQKMYSYKYNRVFHFDMLKRTVYLGCSSIFSCGIIKSYRRSSIPIAYSKFRVPRWKYKP